jgi:hypothetical protein
VSLLQIGKDGEMQVKAEYRGKIVYLVEPDDPDDELADTADYLLMAISFN